MARLMEENRNQLERGDQHRPPQGEDDDGEDADGGDEDDLIVIAAVPELPVRHHRRRARRAAGEKGKKTWRDRRGLVGSGK